MKKLQMKEWDISHLEFSLYGWSNHVNGIISLEWRKWFELFMVVIMCVFSTNFLGFYKHLGSQSHLKIFMVSKAWINKLIFNEPIVIEKEI